MKHEITFSVNGDIKATILGETFSNVEPSYTRTYDDEEYVSIQNIISSQNIDVLSDIVLPEDVSISEGDTSPIGSKDDLPINDPLTSASLISLVKGIMGQLIHGSSINVCNVLNVTTAGLRVQLPNIPCREVTVIAKRLNTEYIYVGDNLVSSTRYGAELGVKEAFTFSVANANQVYIDSSVSGEGISYVAI